MAATPPGDCDIILIGAGIMSATLGVFLKELAPSTTIALFETLEDCGARKLGSVEQRRHRSRRQLRDELHAERPDGSVDISRALEVNVEFDLSRQFWSYFVRKGAIADPRDFIHPLPHMSFVHDAANVGFLKKRFAAMSAHHCYHGMEYSDDPQKIAEWTPLVMEGRTADELVAATRIVTGADVDYGALTHLLVHRLESLPGFSVHYRSRVTRSCARERGALADRGRRRFGRRKNSARAKFVFVGAGGGRCRSCRNPAFPRATAMPAFPSAASGFAATIPRWRAPRSQGLRQGGGRLAAHVRSPPRYASHWG